jgi:hypothetical protein
VEGGDGRYEFNDTREDMPGFRGPTWGTADDLISWLGLAKDPPPEGYGGVFGRLGS